jgi:hypothetical protein
MPRVKTQKKTRAGGDKYCGRCSAKIEPGESYYRWSFRYGGARQNCFRHSPRPSELTQSLMSAIYSAVEVAEDAMESTSSVEEIKELVESVESAASEVTEGYREAAESFGGAGGNGERADELDGWVSELQQFAPDEEADDEFKEVALREIVAETGCNPDSISYDDEDAVIQVFMIDEAVLGDKVREVAEEQGGGEALSDVRNEALELIGSCPL